MGLKYNDIEGLKTAVPSVVIRPNSYRPTKTQSSIRRVPLFALLKPDELSFFINFVQSNIGDSSNKFIFTLSSDQRPIDDHVPLQLLRRVLKDISIDDGAAEHTFHGFRHTAVSNLSLALLGPLELVKALTDYEKTTYCESNMAYSESTLMHKIAGTPYQVLWVTSHLSVALSITTILPL
ncbi:hypothetical protein Psyaliredsea_24300 [Psychrobacter alimentarius]